MASADPFITGHVDLDHEWRGGQRQVTLLTTGLAEAGHPTVVFTRPGSPLAQHLADSPVRVYPLRAWGEWDLLAAGRLARAVRRLGVQVLAAHASHAHGLAALTRLFGLRIPLVVHRRVDFHLAGHRLNRWKYAAPAGFVAISEAIRDMLVEDGIPAEKITVISSGVPPHRPVADAKRLLAGETGLNPDLPWVGDVASFVDHKGHRHLLDAWAKVVAAGEQAELVLIGDGPLRPELERQIARLGLGARTHLVGWRNDIPVWLSALDVFAMTSVTEGLCSTILDAMAARLPVVATAAGGIPEMVRHEQTGWLAPVGDAEHIAALLRRALHDREETTRLVERAYQTVWLERSADRMVEKTLAFYRTLAWRGVEKLLRK